jgi:hypothetical protein
MASSALNTSLLSLPRFVSNTQDSYNFCHCTWTPAVGHGKPHCCSDTIRLQASQICTISDTDHFRCRLRHSSRQILNCSRNALGVVETIFPSLVDAFPTEDAAKQDIERCKREDAMYETAEQLVDIAIKAHMRKFGVDRETASY